MTQDRADGGMRKRSKSMLALCVAVAIATIALLTYLAADRPTAPRGAQGPLTQEPRTAVPPAPLQRTPPR